MLLALIAAAAGLPQETPAVVPQDHGTIVLYRPESIMGAAIGCPIRYKGTELVELGRGKFAEWSVPNGRYVLSNKTSNIEITVAPGERRYVRCVIKPGFMSGKADLQVVEQNDFDKHGKDYQRKEIHAPDAVP